MILVQLLKVLDPCVPVSLYYGRELVANDVSSRLLASSRFRDYFPYVVSSVTLSNSSSILIQL